MRIGIDIGGSTTDIVAIENNEIKKSFSVTASDAITSASGAIGRFITQESMNLSDLRKIAVTGAGAFQLGKSLLGLDLKIIQEFRSIGSGGLFLSGLKEAVVVSMGTGTALVYATNGTVKHIGGTGVGGGTLIGLARYMLDVTEFKTLCDMAQKGKLDAVDLNVGDLSPKKMGSLPLSATASNFGKHSDHATKNDLALGIINLVCQSIGVSSVFAARSCNVNTVILTGKLIRIPNLPLIFEELSDLFNIHFLIPDHAEYATAIGAASTLQKEE